MKPYRNNMQIMSTILQATQDSDRNGIQVTTLINKSNLSHPRLKNFLGKLISNGLINQIEFDGKHTFIITEAGMLYLEEYKKFKMISDSFGLEL